MKNKAAVYLTLAVLTAVPGFCAESALEALKEPVESVMHLLQDPQYKDAARRDEQRDKLWEIAKGLFDFDAIARGTLKRYRWNQFTPEQRERFTDVFTRFVAQNYFNQIQNNYQNDQVVFLRQDLMSDSKARVQTVIRRESLEIPVDYSMWRRKGRWQIYNVYVEGVSLLGNYRSEFERFLNQHTPAELIGQLEEKRQALLDSDS